MRAKALTLASVKAGRLCPGKKPVFKKDACNKVRVQLFGLSCFIGTVVYDTIEGTWDIFKMDILTY